MKNKKSFGYDNLNYYQKWGKLIEENYENDEFLYITDKSKFKIDNNTKVSTAGSCFAQKISTNLIKYGFNFHITEPGPLFLNKEELAKYSYREYSARYGNIYSTMQLYQLVNTAFNKFESIDKFWKNKDKFYDPFRPRIQPNGFDSLDELNQDRKSHLCSVRELFESTDVFIFTLGLTEVWINSIDNSVYPTCPGRGYGEFDPDIHIFENLSFEKNVYYLSECIDLITKINPKIKFILTVSPVPLAATMEKRNIIQSTTYSKSTLRSVAEYITNNYENVDYFQSYEIIVNPYKSIDYFEKDRRSVNSMGVERVMNYFFKTFTDVSYSDITKLIENEQIIEPKLCDEEELRLFLNNSRD